MKRIFIFTITLLLLGFHLDMDAKNRSTRYDCVYSFFPPVRIADVAVCDTATTISFTWNSGKNAWRLDIPELVYLCDSHGRKYEQKGMEGISRGKNLVKQNTKVQFTMSFAPLPEGESCFDVISGTTFDRVFCFYGVHPKSKKAMEYKTYVPARPSRKLDFSKYGNVHIKGKIIDFDPRGKGKEIVLSCISHTNGYGTNEVFSSCVDSLGMFELEALDVKPGWRYLYIDNVEIPVFLTPDDSVSCIVHNFKKYNQSCEISSWKGMDTHPRLMSADPNGPYCPQLEHRGVIQPLKKTKKQIQREQDKIFDFYHYLAWKYKLTSMELSLMQMNMKERLEITWFRSVCTHLGEEAYDMPETILNDERWESCPEAWSLQRNLNMLHK